MELINKLENELKRAWSKAHAAKTQAEVQRLRAEALKIYRDLIKTKQRIENQ